MFNEKILKAKSLKIKKKFQRINSSDKAAQQNIPSGAVIDSVITSPVITEFYLTPHQAFQVR